MASCSALGSPRGLPRAQTTCWVSSSAATSGAGSAAVRIRSMLIGRCAVSLSLMALLWQSSIMASRADDIRFAVLPFTQATQPEHLCSRAGPGHISGGWDPTARQIDEAEALLPDYVRSLARQVPRLERPFLSLDESYRQYLGVVIDGRRLIYVNLFRRPALTDWRTHFIHVCDGGAVFWGVLFDPRTRRFSFPQFNGTM